MLYSPNEWLRIVHIDAPEAFVTGSRAFGTGKDPSPYALHVEEAKAKEYVSDTDIAVLVDHKEAVKRSLCAMFSSYSDSCYNNGFKFDTMYGTINIVPLHPLDFVCWKLTTKHMQEVLALCLEAKARVQCRETKLGIFEALTGIHKMLIPYSGTESCDRIAERIEA